LSLWNKLSLWVPVAAFMALLYLLSARTDLHSVPSGWDKLAHVSAYAVLGALCLRAFHGGLHWLGRWQSCKALLLTVTYGLVDELHQGLVPGRDPSVFDWGADVLGSGIGLACVALLVAWRSRGSRLRSLEQTKS